MDAQTLMEHVGEHGMFRNGKGLGIPVEVRNAKQSYGKLRLLITPRHGEGTTWVDADSVEVESE